MNESKTNLPASIRQRLTNLSRSQSVPFQEILQRYAIERFLSRLSRSEHAGTFVLKGAQMLVAWGSPRTPTCLHHSFDLYCQSAIPAPRQETAAFGKAGPPLMRRPMGGRGVSKCGALAHAKSDTPDCGEATHGPLDAHSGKAEGALPGPLEALPRSERSDAWTDGCACGHRLLFPVLNSR